MLSRRKFIGLLGAALAVAPSLSFPARQLVVPMDWNRPQSKLDLIKALLARGIESHDQLIEEAIFNSCHHTLIAFDGTTHHSALAGQAQTSVFTVSIL